MRSCNNKNLLLKKENEMIKKLSLQVSGFILFFSCQTKNHDQFHDYDLKLTNAQEVAPNEEKGVVLIQQISNGQLGGSCTASAIAHNLLLTAAHCVHGADSIIAYHTDEIDKNLDLIKQLVGVQTRNISTSVSFDIHDSYKDECLINPLPCTGIDLAVVKFKPNTFENIRQIDLENQPEPSNEEELKLVGYGRSTRTYFIFFVPPIKRIGKNSLHQVLEAGDDIIVKYDAYDISFESNLGPIMSKATLLLYGYSGFTRNNVPITQSSSASYGDSGGPLLHDEKIIGVASAALTISDADQPNAAMSFYSSLYHSKEWLKRKMSWETITLNPDSRFAKVNMEAGSYQIRMIYSAWSDVDLEKAGVNFCQDQDKCRRYTRTNSRGVFVHGWRNEIEISPIENITANSQQEEEMTEIRLFSSKRYCLGSWGFTYNSIENAQQVFSGKTYTLEVADDRQVSFRAPHTMKMGSIILEYQKINNSEDNDN